MGWVALERLGQGSHACVDLVIDYDAPTRYFAVKTSLDQESASLKKEFGLLRLFSDCPHIVRCFGVDKSIDKNSNLLYHLKLEYAPGGTLLDLITKNGGSLSEKEVKRYTRMIVHGLCCLHRCFLVHCDIKPANILVFPGEDGMPKVKIADLGLAKLSGDPHPKYKFHGTPTYASPESVRDGDIRTAMDIWSLGCTVTEMLTGQCPWGDCDTISMVRELSYGWRTPVIPDNLSKEGKDFLKKCFCNDPDRRWTAEMLLNHPFLLDHEKYSNNQLKELCHHVKSALGFDEVVQNRGIIPSSSATPMAPPRSENQPRRPRALVRLLQDLKISQEGHEYAKVEKD